MEKEKLGITPLNWILSIAGMLVLLCFIVLPLVFRTFFKEEKVIEKEGNLVVEHMTCTKKNYVVERHFESDTIEFTYVADRLNKWKRVKTMTFDDLESFDKYKEEYGRMSNAYGFVKNGVIYELNVDNSVLKLTVTEEYNLGTFQNTSITLPGEEQEVQLNSEYTRDMLVSSIKNDLVDSRYNCVNK